MKKYFLSFIFILCFVSMVVQPVLAEQKTVIVANTRDWHDLYLSSIYAGSLNTELLYFENLADAQLKTRMISKNDNVVILESRNNPIVKNYESFLKKSGYTDIQPIYFDDYLDLQEFIFKDIKYDGIFVLNPDYGLVSVAAAPYIIKNKYIPFFINEKNLNSLKKVAKGKNVIVAGKIPVRSIKGIDGKIMIGSPFSTTKQIMDMVAENSDSQWGRIVKLDSIDLITLQQEMPLFIYYGDKYLDYTISSVADSKIKNFEVIGGGTADIATNIKSRIPHKINLLLKYGRTITNLDGMQGKILNIDSVPFELPFENLKLTKSVYYPNMNILAVTFKNVGNIDIMFFSNMEFMRTALSDENSHHLLIGQEKTIPFYVDETNSSKENVIVTTKFGEFSPMRNTLKNDDGGLVLKTPVETDQYSENSSLDFIGSEYDYSKGILKLKFKNLNNHNIVAFSELILNDGDTVLTSEKNTFAPNQEGTLLIKTPYIYNEELSDKILKVVTYFGERDTFNSETTSVHIEKYSSNLLTSYIVKAGATSVVVIIVVIIFVVSFFLFGKKKKKKKDSKNKVRKKTTSHKKNKAVFKPRRKKR